MLSRGETKSSAKTVNSEQTKHPCMPQPRYTMPCVYSLKIKILYITDIFRSPEDAEDGEPEPEPESEPEPEADRR